MDFHFTKFSKQIFIAWNISEWYEKW